MEDQRKVLMLRHYIGKGAAEEQINELRAGVQRINTAEGISHDRSYGLEFGLKVTVHEDAKPEEKAQIRRELTKLNPDVWTLVDPRNRDAGVSFRQTLLGNTFGDDYLIGLCCFDQWRVDTEEGLASANDLFERVRAEGTLYATGSRDVPVHLAPIKRWSDARIIHELFDSLAGGNCFRVPEDRQKERGTVTPAYREIGESTSGFYILNPRHRSFLELKRNLDCYSKNRGLTGFSNDYYTAIFASQGCNSGKPQVSTGYVGAYENKFYGEQPEEKVKARAEGIIKGQSRELGKTDRVWETALAVKNESNVDRIAEFYDKEQVRDVQRMMLAELRLA